MEAKRLFRSRKYNIIGGVCGGLSDYFKMDVVLVRLIFTLGMFFSCIFPFFLLYVALWIAVPMESE
jgi:phage shock protein C